jgi:DNA-directed RNA polymerase specialized sigma24 family protein
VDDPYETAAKRDHAQAARLPQPAPTRTSRALLLREWESMTYGEIAISLV